MKIFFTSSSDGSAVFTGKDETTGKTYKVTIEGLEPDTQYELAVSPVDASRPVYKPEDPTTVGSEGH